MRIQNKVPWLFSQVQLLSKGELMAGPYYVRSSDGNDGDDGLSWANAKATLGAAVGLAAAGERIYVDDDHQETLTADVIYAFAGTEGNPVEVIVVLTNTTTAVANYNAGIQWIEGDTGNDEISLGGYSYFWGIFIEAGDMSTNFVRIDSSATFERSKIKLEETTGDYLGIYGDNAQLNLIDSDIEFAHVSNYIKLTGTATVTWIGGTLTGDQNNLFYISDDGGVVRATGIDISSMNGGNIFYVAEGSERILGYLKGIKLHAANPTLITAGVSPEKGTEVLMDIADNGNTIYKFRREYQYGYAQDETTKVITGKALYDGVNEFTAKMVSRTAPTASYFDPWRYHLTTLRETGFAANRTYTVHIAQDDPAVQPAALNDDEVWLEVVYPDDANAKYNIKTDKIATPTTAAAAQTASVEVWEGLAATTRLQELSVQIDAADGKNGPVEIWVCLAKESITMYVCPEVYVS